jgi:ABC-type branched-subunit amino acid transport system substrate-binding protein
MKKHSVGASRVGRPRLGHRNQLAAVACAAVVVAVIAGCGSSASSQTASPPSSTAGSSAVSSPSTGGSAGTSSLPASGPGTGSGTVKVGVECASSGKNQNPECLQTFNALADYANANGGINGYKIEIDNCDVSTAGATPSVTANCATKQAVEDGVDAIVATNGGIGVTPVMEAHNIPIIAPIDVDTDFDTSPVSFPVWSWEGADWGGLIQDAVQNGLKKPAYTNPESAFGASPIASIKQGYAKYSITPSQVSAPLTAVSFQSQVLSLKSKNVDTVYPLLPASSIVAMVKTASAINYKPQWGVVWNTYDQRIEKILSPLSSSASLVTAIPFKSYQTAGGQMSSVVQKYSGKSVDFSYLSIDNYVGMEMLFQALSHMSGPATSQKILSQMGTQSFTSEWLPAPVSWSTSHGALCRIASTATYIMKMENGAWTQAAGPNNIDIAPIAGCKS